MFMSGGDEQGSYYQIYFKDLANIFSISMQKEYFKHTTNNHQNHLKLEVKIIICKLHYSNKQENNHFFQSSQFQNQRMLLKRIQINILLIMKGLVQKSDNVSDTDSVASNSSFIITQKDLQRSKRKKKAAFQSFLVMPQPQDDSFPRKRKLSNHQMEQQTLQVPNTCKICNKILRDKVKVCDFCKDTMCIIHFRKARLNMSTKKFSRICDYCEDKKLMEKHFQNLIKSEETLLSEEIVTQQKYNRLRLQLEGKRIRLQMLKDKQKDLRQLKTAKQNSLTRAYRQLERDWKQMYKQMDQINKREENLRNIEAHLPHSQQKDYKAMQKEKEKVVKTLSKVTRQCENIIWTKSSIERKMYEDLYQWQLIQKYKMKQQQKKDQCKIY